jgi:hypothetical protein
MKSWTVAQMLAERPCSRYDEARITKLWGKHKSRTLAEILRDRRIPLADRMWCVWRKDALTKPQAKAVLDRIVTRAVTNHALKCGIPKVEAWAHGWLDGTDRSRTNADAAANAYRLQIADVLAVIEEGR